MSDIKLFKTDGKVEEFQSSAATLEKELQTLIEKNMQTFFGITFLASEYRTTNGGRMDSIGIDENFCPVIFEYKRSKNDNVMNQGLFYLDWLLDHKDSFKLLVLEKMGKEAAGRIDWTMPRVICIAGDFTKYDESAIHQMNRNISLIRYRLFGKNLLMFEQINSNTVEAIPEETPSGGARSKPKTFAEQYENASRDIVAIYDSLKDYIMSLGDDISENHLKLYTAFRKIRNFVCAEIFANKIVLYLRLDTTTVNYEKGFICDASSIGHWGTGNVEVSICSREDFERAKPLLDRAYEEN